MSVNDFCFDIQRIFGPWLMVYTLERPPIIDRTYQFQTGADFDFQGGIQFEFNLR